MKQFAQYLKSIEQHIEAGYKLADAMKVFRPAFMKATPEEQLAMRSSVAKLISIKKRVARIHIESGIYKGSEGFESAKNGGSPASEQARKMLAYYMPTSLLVEKTSTTVSKQVKKSNVDKLVEAFEAMSKAEQAKFLRIIG